MNKLGRGPLDDVSYQISNIKALGFVVSDKKIFFMFLPILVCVKHVTPGAGSFLAQGQ